MRESLSGRNDPVPSSNVKGDPVTELQSVRTVPGNKRTPSETVFHVPHRSIAPEENRCFLNLLSSRNAKIARRSIPDENGPQKTGCRTDILKDRTGLPIRIPGGLCPPLIVSENLFPAFAPASPSKPATNRSLKEDQDFSRQDPMVCKERTICRTMFHPFAFLQRTAIPLALPATRGDRFDRNGRIFFFSACRRTSEWHGRRDFPVRALSRKAEAESGERESDPRTTMEDRQHGNEGSRKRQ